MPSLFLCEELLSAIKREFPLFVLEVLSHKHKTTNLEAHIENQSTGRKYIESLLPQ